MNKEKQTSVFGPEQPVSEFEKGCQALRGWRIGDIAADPEDGFIGVVTEIWAPAGELSVTGEIVDTNEHSSRWYNASNLINLSRGE